MRVFDLASTSSAKSIIMIAFFFAMPINKMMPIKAITLRSVRHLLAHVEAAELGHHDVEQDQVGVEAGDFIERVAAIDRHLNGAAAWSKSMRCASRVTP